MVVADGDVALVFDPSEHILGFVTLPEGFYRSGNEPCDLVVVGCGV